MSGKTEVVKGRLEEAAGVLTDNDNLRNKGKADQAVGKAKQVTSAQKALDKAKNAAKTKVTGCD
jgi:uncharacterized protein YjbJ (UPF0337 family)